MSDDGTVSCNRGPKRTIPGEQLVEARGLTEDLAADLNRPVAEVPKVAPVYTFELTMGAGTATWQDGSLGLPKSYLKLSQLVRQIAKGTCGLTR